MHAPQTAATRKLEFDPGLLGRLAQQGPRYSSYPTADRFNERFAYRDYLQAVAGRRTQGSVHPLSLYVHIPFCDAACYFCACNKIVTRDRSKAVTYLAYLKREIDMQARLFAGINRVEQLHFGGGTPTYLSDEQLDDLCAHLRRCFAFAPDGEGEYSIEVDPRTVTAERIARLRRQGFNRISLGVQDFDPAVQKAVNRVHTEHEVRALVDAARDASFRSVSMDLIYGLPRQSAGSMAATLAKVIAANPDRIAVYNYAHLPHRFKAQRRIVEAELPDAAGRLAILGQCIDTLRQAGYIFIGMDHFAKPSDGLAIAQLQGRLHRSFQGYATHAGTDLVACGVSAISAVAATYSQNVKTLGAYYQAIDRNELPVARGVRLNMDDVLRRAIIQTLMCQFELSIGAIEQAYPVSFADYFGPELERLRRLESDGLVEMEPGWISVTARGRVLIRNVCMVFDRYLAHRTGNARHSHTI